MIRSTPWPPRTAPLLVLLHVMISACAENPAENEFGELSGSLAGPAQVAVTDTATIVARFFDDTGREFKDLPVTWSVDDPDVLTITPHPDDDAIGAPSARATARKTGTTRIRAKATHSNLPQVEATLVVNVGTWNVAPATPWEDTLWITQIDTLEIDIPNADSMSAASLRVVWTSQNDAIASVVREIPPDTANRQQVYLAKRRAIIAARRRGNVSIGVSVTREGFETSEIRKSITIVPLSIVPTPAWPDTMHVEEDRVLEVVVRNHRGIALNSARVKWESNDPDSSRFWLIANPANAASHGGWLIPFARAFARVTAAIDEPGYERMEYKDSISIMEAWQDISAGYMHTCAIAANRSLACWGSFIVGTGFSSAASTLFPGREMNAVSTGGWNPATNGAFTCAVSRESVALCWGTNTRGELGASHRIDRFNPNEVIVPSTVRSITASEGFACASPTVESTATVCWGLNNVGQLGTRSSLPMEMCGLQSCSLVGRAVDFLVGPAGSRIAVPLALSEISAGSRHTCGIFSQASTITKFPAGSAACWGHLDGILAGPTQTDTAISVPGNRQYRQMASGASHSCAISAGAAYCWGLNTYGQLGTSGPTSTCGVNALACSLTPVAVAGTMHFNSLSSRNNATCAVTSDGVYCWGSNEHGVLGTSANLPTCAPPNLLAVPCSRTPVRVELPTGRGYVTVSVGHGHACALSHIGEAFCWGGGPSGFPAGQGSKLGDGISDQSRTVGRLPVRVREVAN